MSNSPTNAETAYKDKDGKTIKVHDYVKDGEGNRYFINTHGQAVPSGSDAPAVELSRLIESSEVSVMGIEEVLNMNQPVEKRRRGGRRKATPEKPAESPEKAEALAKAAAEASAKAAAAENKQDLYPVTDEMILRFLPDDVLANELRRRGYTLCAYKPALIQL